MTVTPANAEGHLPSHAASEIGGPAPLKLPPRFQFGLRPLFWATALVASLVSVTAIAWQHREHPFIVHLEFSPSSDVLLATYASGKVKLWDVSTDKPQERPTKLDARAPAEVLYWNSPRFCGPDSLLVAEPDLSRHYVWDLKSDRQSVRLAPVGRQLLGAAPLSGLIFFADNFDFHIVDAKSGTLVRSVNTNSRSLQLASFAADPTGRFVCCDADYQTLEWYETETGQRVATSTFQVPRMVYALPDGETILGADWDDNHGDHESPATFYDRTGKPLRSIRAGIDGMLNAQFTPAGDRFVVWSSEGDAAEVWPTTGEKPLSHIPLTSGAPLTNGDYRNDRAAHVTMSPNGKRVAATGMDVPLRLFDAETGQLLATLGQPTSLTSRWLPLMISLVFAAASALGLSVSLLRSISLMSAAAEAKPYPAPGSPAEEARDVSSIASGLAGVILVVVALLCFGMTVINPFNLSPVKELRGVSYGYEFVRSLILATAIYGAYLAVKRVWLHGARPAPGHYVLVGLALSIVCVLSRDLAFGLWFRDGGSIYSMGHLQRALDLLGYGGFAIALFQAEGRSLPSRWTLPLRVGLVISLALTVVGGAEAVTYLMSLFGGGGFSEFWELVIIGLLVGIGQFAMAGWCVWLLVAYIRDRKAPERYDWLHYFPIPITVALILTNIGAAIAYEIARQYRS